MLGLMIFVNSSWTTTAMIIVGGVVFFAVNLIMRQESMLYVPCVMPGMQAPEDNPKGMRSPADKGMEFEDVYLDTVDGVRVHCWFMPAPGDERKAAPTVLFLHANAGNIGLRVPNFKELNVRLRVNILALDYRGYGRSEGSPSEEGIIEDALAAWRWLSTAAEEGRIDGCRIFVFGRSLGGAVAIALAKSLGAAQPAGPWPCGLILENTFTSISDLVDTLFPVIAFKSLKDRFLRVRWESIDRVRDVDVPILFLVGEQDEMIPPSHSQALHSAAKRSPLRLLERFPDGSHNDTWEKGGENYWQAWARYIAECTGVKAAASSTG